MNITEIAVAFALLLITGCTHDREQPLEQMATLSLRVASGSVFASSPDDQMDQVRIVAFEAAANPTVGSVTTNSGKLALEVGGLITQSLTVGLRDICIFTNEDLVPDLTTKLSGLSSFRDLEAIQIPYTPNLAPPFLSSLICRGMDVKVEGNETLKAQVVRTVAKVVLNLKQVWGTTPVSEVVIDRVQVMGLPAYSYLTGKNYDGLTFVNSEAPTDLVNDSKETNTYQKTFTFYIPEFLGATADEGKHASIEIQGHIKDNPSIICTYSCPLGNGMATEPMADYNIARNRHFTVNGIITGYGQTNRLEIKATVQDWNTVHSTPEEMGQYVKITSIKAGATDLATDPNYKFNRNGETITVALDANVGGTLLEIIDKDGKPIATKTHDDIATKSILFTLPANFGVEGGTPVAARNYTLAITNAKAKITYNADPAANKIEVTRSQGAIVWAAKNVGANNNYESGNFFQLDRNQPFSGATPNSNNDNLVPTYGGAVTLQNQATTYATKFLTAVNKTLWSDNGSIVTVWKDNPTKTPCATIYGNGWRVPSKADAEKLITLLRTLYTNPIKPIGSEFKGLYFGTSDTDRIFVGCTGFRWALSGTYTDSDIRGHFLTNERSDAEGVFSMVYISNNNPITAPIVSVNEWRHAYPLRCVQYID